MSSALSNAMRCAAHARRYKMQCCAPHAHTCSLRASTRSAAQHSAAQHASGTTCASGSGGAARRSLLLRAAWTHPPLLHRVRLARSPPGCRNKGGCTAQRSAALVAPPRFVLCLCSSLPLFCSVLPLVRSSNLCSSSRLGGSLSRSHPSDGSHGDGGAALRELLRTFLLASSLGIQRRATDVIRTPYCHLPSSTEAAGIGCAALVAGWFSRQPLERMKPPNDPGIWECVTDRQEGQSTRTWKGSSEGADIYGLVAHSQLRCSASLSLPARARFGPTASSDAAPAALSRPRLLLRKAPRGAVGEVISSCR